MNQFYVMTVKTAGYVAIRIFRDPAKAMREASITRNSYVGAQWIEIKDGHVTTNGNGKTGMNHSKDSIKVTLKPITVE